MTRRTDRPRRGGPGEYRPPSRAAFAEFLARTRASLPPPPDPGVLATPAGPDEPENETPTDRENDAAGRPRGDVKP